MIILSYGYEKPVNPDTGDKFFPAMERNIQRMNDHTHNGVDSAPLLSVGSPIPTGLANWVSIGSGLYEQELTLPAGREYDTTEIWFRASDGNRALLDTIKTSNTTYKVKTNQPLENYLVYYR